MSSVHEVIPWAGHVNYAASKGAGDADEEPGPGGRANRIRVNSIAPGAVRTPINRPAWETPEALASLLELIPLQADRRAGGYCAGRGAGLRRLGLRQRHDAVRRWRHDALSGIRFGRVRWSRRSGCCRRIGRNT